MSFKSEDKNISGILDKRVIYLIPRNQRRYVWTTDNWKDILEDLDFSIKNPSRPHFMGSIVLEKKNDDNGVEVYSIIDGQQRITTILLFIATIMYLFKERSEQANFEGLKNYLITHDLSNKEFCKLLTERYPSLGQFISNVCDWDKNYESVSKLIGESSTASKQNNDIFDAYLFFSLI